MSFADTLEAQLDLRQAFQDLPDQRVERNKRHSRAAVIPLLRGLRSRANGLPPVSG
jgi:hypothetical protein